MDPARVPVRAPNQAPVPPRRYGPQWWGRWGRRYISPADIEVEDDAQGPDATDRRRAEGVPEEAGQ